MIKGFAFLAIAVLANLLTNFSLKTAVRGLDTSSVGSVVKGLLTSPWAWIGGLGGVLLLASFMAAIRTLPLSVAYPVLTALVIVAMTFIEWRFQNVDLGLWKLIGLALVIAGIALVSNNA
ncbi:MAG: hypothetical protein AAGL23_14155 [Pseudomonadota bacterium]